MVEGEATFGLSSFLFGASELRKDFGLVEIICEEGFMMIVVLCEVDLRRQYK